MKNKSSEFTDKDFVLMILIMFYVIFNLFTFVFGSVEYNKPFSMCRKPTSRWSLIVPGFRLGCKASEFMSKPLFKDDR